MDKKKTEETPITEEEVKKTLEIEEDISEDTPIYYTLPLLIESTNIEDVEFDKDEFQKGLKDASYYAGMYTAFLSVGMSNIDAYTLILTDVQKKLSLKTTEINANATIEASKNQTIMIEKNSL